MNSASQFCCFMFLAFPGYIFDLWTTLFLPIEAHSDLIFLPIISALFWPAFPLFSWVLFSEFLLRCYLQEGNWRNEWRTKERALFIGREEEEGRIVLECSMTLRSGGVKQMRTNQRAEAEVTLPPFLLFLLLRSSRRYKSSWAQNSESVLYQALLAIGPVWKRMINLFYFFSCRKLL